MSEQLVFHTRLGHRNQSFFSDSRKPLPTWEPGQIPENELDLNVKAVRENTLKQIRKEAMKIREEATSVEAAVNDLDTFMQELRTLAIEVILPTIDN